MAGEIKGSALIVSISTDGGSTYTKVAGVREKSFNTEIGEIDVTNDDDNGYHTLIEGGIVSATISISGVMKDRDFLQKILSGSTIHDVKIEWVGTGDVTDANLTGKFQIANVSNSGNYENEVVQFEAELRSTGSFTFTAAADA